MIGIGVHAGVGNSHGVPFSAIIHFIEDGYILYLDMGTELASDVATPINSSFDPFTYHMYSTQLLLSLFSRHIQHLMLKRGRTSYLKPFKWSIDDL